MIDFTSTSYPEPFILTRGPCDYSICGVNSATVAHGTTGRPMFGFSSGGIVPVQRVQSSDTRFAASL